MLNITLTVCKSGYYSELCQSDMIEGFGHVWHLIFSNETNSGNVSFAFFLWLACALGASRELPPVHFVFCQDCTTLRWCVRAFRHLFQLKSVHLYCRI